MKTSLIRYRVADFLKQFPPFNLLSESDLMLLASTGKVSFHETDELVFKSKQTCRPCLWVIQQGRVELVNDAENKTQLIDILGAGEIIGLESCAGYKNYLHGAFTRTDVILYSIDSRAFGQLLNESSVLTDYVESYFSTKNLQAAPLSNQLKAYDRHSASSRPWAAYLGKSPSIDFIKARSQTVKHDQVLHELLAAQLESNHKAVCMVDYDDRPLAVIANKHILAASFDTANHNKAISDCFTTQNLVTLRPNLEWSSYITAMLAHRLEHIVLTTDGSALSAFQGLLGVDDMNLHLGRNPVFLLFEILKSKTLEEWQLCLQQIRIIGVELLSSPYLQETIAQIITCLYDALIESIIGEHERALRPQAQFATQVKHGWLLFGKAGRGEFMDGSRPDIGLIYDDAAGGNNPDLANYFSRLMMTVADCFEQLGFYHQQTDQPTPACMSLQQWTLFIETLVSFPVENDLYSQRDRLDFRYLGGDRLLQQTLASHLRATVKSNRMFIPIMANDTLENLPPLTFFQDMVIAMDGQQKDSLDLETAALTPITDAIRVHALAHHDTGDTNTLVRINRLATDSGASSAIFQQVGEAYRFICYYQQILNGNANFRQTMIQPKLLCKYDQRMLKTSFQAIRNLLEITASPTHWMDCREP